MVKENMLVQRNGNNIENAFYFKIQWKKIRKKFFSNICINTLETNEENIPKITERTYIKI